MSHAMPIVTNTNEMPAKANPTTYQMPVNRTPFERRAGVRAADRRLLAEGTATGDRPGQPPSAILPVGTEGAANRRIGSPWGRLGVGERCASSARAVRAPLPVLVVPDRREDCRGAATAINRAFAVVVGSVSGPSGTRCRRVAGGPAIDARMPSPGTG